MKIRKLLAASLMIGAVAIQPVQAQSVSGGFDDQRLDTRMQMSLTIPFGGLRNDQYSTPRLELSSVRQRSSAFGYRFDQAQNRSIKRSFSLTLEQEPKFLINGQFVASENGRQNISTGEGVLIGAGVIAIVFTIVAIDFTDEITDIVDPD